MLACRTSNFGTHMSRRCETHDQSSLTRTDFYEIASAALRTMPTQIAWNMELPTNDHQSVAFARQVNRITPTNAADISGGLQESKSMKGARRLPSCFFIDLAAACRNMKKIALLVARFYLLHVCLSIRRLLRAIVVACHDIRTERHFAVHRRGARKEKPPLPKKQGFFSSLGRCKAPQAADELPQGLFCCRQTIETQ